VDLNLKNRILTSVILITLVVVCAFNYWTAGFLIILFISLGLYEFFKMLENKGIKPFKLFGMVVGILIPLSILLKVKITRELQFLFVILALLLLFILQFLRRSNEDAVVGISVTIFGILFICWCLSFLIRIYRDFGPLHLLSLIFITKIGDTFSYFSGRFFGKHLLIRRISPQKTWEGSIGGFCGCLVSSLLVREILKLSLLKSLALGMTIGVLAQLGDLCESLVKRDCRVKDSSNILPGLGGVLDILDSIIFVSPAFYCFFKI